MFKGKRFQIKKIDLLILAAAIMIVFAEWTVIHASAETELEESVQINVESSDASYDEMRQAEYPTIDPTIDPTIEVQSESEEMVTSDIAETIEDEDNPNNLVNLGEFRITSYCSCRKCNGKWYGYPTAAGTEYIEGRTIAVDERQIPLGSKVMINGHIYVAEDTGSEIKRNCIDIYCSSHEAAKQFGLQHADVFLVTE